MSRILAAPSRAAAAYMTWLTTDREDDPPAEATVSVVWGVDAACWICNDDGETMLTAAGLAALAAFSDVHGERAA